MADRKADQKIEISEVKTFTVPFSIGEIKKDISINTNTPYQPSKEQIINQALKFQSQGKIKEAAKYYQHCINQGYKDHRVFSNFGIVLKNHGKLQEAALLQRKAIEVEPNFAEGHSNLGIVLRDLGKLKEAELATRKAIELKPNYAEAHSNLGNVLRDLGRLQEAKVYARKATEIRPDYFEAYYHLGTILNSLGKLQQAVLTFRKAIELKPDSAEAYSNLGAILKDLGNLKEAELATRKAIELKPDNPNANSNLGAILKDLGNLKEAELVTRKAIELKPDFAEAHLNLGNILNSCGKLQQSELATRKAIEIKPDFADAHLNLGSILISLDKLHEAEIATRKAIELKPDFAIAYSNLGNILSNLGKLEEAQEVFKKCIEIDPNEVNYLSSLLGVLSSLCSWDEIEKYSAYLNRIEKDSKTVMNPFHLMHIENNLENELKRAIEYSQISKRQQLPNLTSYKHSKINIAYFSSDFRNHAVSIVLTRILELHDSSRFNIYAYSLTKKRDAYTERIENAVYCFREVSNLSDIEIVNMARNDQIDIAIDLNGITKLNRKSIFDYRVAPKQISFLGYPGTMGSKSFDYKISKKILIPEEDKKFYTEKIIYLPDKIVPIDDTIKVSYEKFSKEDLGLPIDGFVFTCFNRIEKITRKEFNIWMRLLKKINKSVLWLVKPHKVAIQNLYSELNKHSIDKKRIIFADIVSLNDHLSRHIYGDLFLDTFNYNAGTTGSLSLWAGLPIITLAGKTIASRTSASYLHACNLNELITYNEDDYESLAYELAKNKEKILRVRNKLDKNKSLCFDSCKYTIELEKIYTDINSDVKF